MSRSPAAPVGAVRRTAGMLSLLAVISDAGCSAPVAAETPASASKSARQRVAEGARLLDVRTPEEFADRHIDGALNIPVSELSARLVELGPRDRPLVVYCRSGNRSATAAKILREAGFADVFDLGPLSAW